MPGWLSYSRSHLFPTHRWAIREENAIGIAMRNNKLAKILCVADLDRCTLYGRIIHPRIVEIVSRSSG
jgi:hypothetical protein